MLGLTFSSQLDWGSYIISIAKTASEKIRALIFSMKLLSPDAALYLYKSTCMKYCCHVWDSARSCYWELQDRLQKRHAGLLVLHFFSIGITLVDVHLNWRNWFHFFILERGLLVILIDLMIFLSPFVDVIRTSMSTVSFLEQLDFEVLCLQNAFLRPMI